MFNLGFGSYNCSPSGAIFGAVIEVGKYSSIAQDCMFLGKGGHLGIRNRNFVSVYPFDQKEYTGDWGTWEETDRIVIGNDVWIGFRSTILNGVTIGDGAIVGAGTLVAKDVPPYSVFLGNPGKVHHYRFDPDVVWELRKIAWWEWPDEVIRQRMNDFNDVTSFIQKYG